MTSEKDIDFNKEYWDKFYAASHRHVPSQFCVCMVTELPSDSIVVELGSGNGRDAMYLASRGHIIVATDLSEQAIKSSSEVAIERGLNHATFVQSDLTDSKSVNHVVALAREQVKGGNVVFYSRFIMHSLDDDQELKFLSILTNSMAAGEVVYFEFRSKEDEGLEKVHKGHFRRYVDTDIFKQRLLDLGFDIEYSITGMGMAKYKTEDPFVSRIIARKA